jgi:hypothetical protein
MMGKQSLGSQINMGVKGVDKEEEILDSLRGCLVNTLNLGT